MNRSEEVAILIALVVVSAIVVVRGRPIDRWDVRKTRHRTLPKETCGKLIRVSPTAERSTVAQMALSN